MFLTLKDFHQTWLIAGPFAIGIHVGVWPVWHLDTHRQLQATTQLRISWFGLPYMHEVCCISNQMKLTYLLALFSSGDRFDGHVMAMDGLYSRSSASVKPEGPINSIIAHSMFNSLARSSFLWGSTFSMKSRTSWSLVKLYLKPILNKVTPTSFAWWVNVWQGFVFGRHLDTKSWSFMVESHFRQVERIISASPSSSNCLT